MACVGENSGSTQEALPETVNRKETHVQIVCNPSETSSSGPRPFMGSPKHGHPQTPSQLLFPLSKSKITSLNAKALGACFSDSISLEFLQGSSYIHNE